jgi:hypothetical protein
LKKFILKILLLLASVSMVIGGLLFVLLSIVAPQHSQDFGAALMDKIQYLKSIDEPKIVLIGDSNLIFGIDSKKIEEAFRMPVVNMGLNAQYGNAFNERMARLNVKKGDIYIISHIYYYDDGLIPDPNAVWVSIENHYSLYPLIPITSIPRMIAGFPKYIIRSATLWLKHEGNAPGYGAYTRTAFNKYGDNIFPREKSKSDRVLQEAPIQLTSDACVRRLNRLNAYLTKRGATLLIAGCPIGTARDSMLTNLIPKFQQELTQKLDCAVISNFSDYLFDLDYIYDENYHLTDAGAALRTQQLIKDLQQWGLH